MKESLVKAYLNTIISECEGLRKIMLVYIFMTPAQF